MNTFAHPSAYIMKLHLEQDSTINLITGYGANHVMINKQRHDGNMLVDARRVLTDWAPGGFAGLSADDMAAVVELGPEVVLIGTGERLRFPPVALLRPLIEARIGYEVMDLAAACRTYNVLVSEGRSVATALLFDPR